MHISTLRAPATPATPPRSPRLTKHSVLFLGGGDSTFQSLGGVKDQARCLSLSPPFQPFLMGIAGINHINPWV